MSGVMNQILTLKIMDKMAQDWLYFLMSLILLNNGATGAIKHVGEVIMDKASPMRKYCRNDVTSTTGLAKPI